MNRLFLAPVMRWLGKLSHPRLFLLAAAVFVLDLITPDLIPFMPADEIVQAVILMGLANWKKHRQATPGSDANDIEGESVRH